MPDARPIAIEALGDRGFLARFETEVEAARWAQAVDAAGWLGVVDVIPAYRTVGVLADPGRLDLDDLASRLKMLSPLPASGAEGRRLYVPVLYDGEDLADVAGRLGLGVRDVIAEHGAQDYRVFAIGFQPGFPYAGYLPPRLSGLARRPTPRTHVAPGSVAIVGRQTAIYPGASPGGWFLIGRTPMRIVDVASGRFPIRAGDRLRFVSIDRDEFESRRGEFL